MTKKSEEKSPGRRHIAVFLWGDVMIGRGIDQVLPYPGNPRIYEPYMRSAKGCVELAERANGPIPKPVDATIDPSDGKLVSLRMIPTQIKHFRVNRASAEDAIWLQDLLNREVERYGTKVELGKDNLLTLLWNGFGPYK